MLWNVAMSYLPKSTHTHTHMIETDGRFFCKQGKRTAIQGAPLLKNRFSFSSTRSESYLRYLSSFLVKPLCAYLRKEKQQEFMQQLQPTVLISVHAMGLHAPTTSFLISILQTYRHQHNFLILYHNCKIILCHRCINACL